MAIDINLPAAEIKRQVNVAIEREQTEKRNAEAKRVDNELDRRARRAFFGVQPGASESAYESIKDALKQLILLDDAKRADQANGRLHSIYSDF
jgi:hypothetical protein